MNSHRPPAAPRDERDFDWMDSTFPLHHERIQFAIDSLTAANARADARGERQAPARAPTPGSGSLYARVIGPVKGYYIASHASRPRERFASYVGDYKICEALPSSYWSAQALVAGCCRHAEATGMAAMANAEAEAVRRIDDMPILIDRL